MGELIELDTGYNPTKEQLDKNEEQQTEIKRWRHYLRSEHEKKFYQAWDIFLSWQRFHNGIRSNWKVYRNSDQG